VNGDRFHARAHRPTAIAPITQGPVKLSLNTEALNNHTILLTVKYRAAIQMAIKPRIDSNVIVKFL
jgi:hypothetical protein